MFCEQDRSILTSDTNFRCLRNYFNDVRCQILTRLVRRGVSGEQLIRAFEQVPNLIEEMYLTNSNVDNVHFIDQLANIAYDSITNTPPRCVSPSRRSQISINQNLPLSTPVQSVVKVKSTVRTKRSLPSKTHQLTLDPSPSPSVSESIPVLSQPITPPDTSRSSVPQSASYHSSDDSPFSMGYQWKGEDN
ncbi:unnamed protein product [Adineta ricciae]|uniref:Uncharacterized protein n=1 Tax=Adineta ricciae TaxID=249248 RepID=A0A814VCW2_ADIRI|nr:unnamed protein product [Adineta ricciae]CAF1188871.1 unnamed protein product [Adineta ricciae]